MHVGGRVYLKNEEKVKGYKRCTIINYSYIPMEWTHHLTPVPNAS